MDNDIQEFLSSVKARCPHLEDIWLIGSRANGTARAGSDWDFLAFGSVEAIHCIEQCKDLHRAHVDFLVVTNGDDFRSAWGEIDKCGSLSEWGWCRISDKEARYTATKKIRGQGGVVCMQSKALRV